MGVLDLVISYRKKLLSARPDAFALFAIATSLGFGAAKYLDMDLVTTANAQRDLAKDCLQWASTKPKCPVVYGRVSPPQIKVVTKLVTVTDPAQAAEISRLRKLVETLSQNKSLREQRQSRHSQDELAAQKAPLAVSGF